MKNSTALSKPRLSKALLRFVPITCIFMLTACKQSVLEDTLHFAPGTIVNYKGKLARLYGDSLCSVGRLNGIASLIFVPDKTTAQATSLEGKSDPHLMLHVKRDTDNPTQYLVVDDEYANLRLLD